MAESSNDVMRPNWFSGANFRRWQSKAKLLLLDLKLFWVISSPQPLPVECEDAMRRWEDANTRAIGHLFAVLPQTLVDSYRSYTVAGELWEELEKNYSSTDYRNEVFLVERCSLCGKTGHTVRFCCERKEGKPRGGNQQGQQVVANFVNAEPENSGFQHSSPA